MIEVDVLNFCLKHVRHEQFNVDCAAFDELQATLHQITFSEGK